MRKPPSTRLLHRIPLAAVLTGTVLGTLVSTALRADPDPAILARIEYTPPVPGTYALPPIQRAVDGTVLDTQGKRRQLFEYLGEGPVVLSFIYTTCSDSRGCPLATAVLRRTAVALAADPELSTQVRLITLSFDPEHDTPEMMRHHADLIAGSMEGARPEGLWTFLTTASRTDLQPLLDGYGQYVVRERDASGRETGVFAHVLKVFLIDRQRRVRNIYSTSFLYPELLMSDLRTLLLEQ